MTKLMDDPTTYLSRDTEDVAIMLASSVESAMFQAKQYGVSIQVNMPGDGGIRVVSTLADAINVRSLYPPSTPWCVVDDERTWEMGAVASLTNYFGPPQTVAKALNVEQTGVAWNPKTMPVYGYNMKAIARKPRVWEANIPTTAMAHGPLSDWPPQMQDAVYEAMEEVLKQTGVRGLEMIQCVCLHDELGYWVTITLMEELGPEDVVIMQ